LEQNDSYTANQESKAFSKFTAIREPSVKPSGRRSWFTTTWIKTLRLLRDASRGSPTVLPIHIPR